jgi:hypothetical protein
LQSLCQHKTAQKNKKKSKHDNNTFERFFGLCGQVVVLHKLGQVRCKTINLLVEHHLTKQNLKIQTNNNNALNVTCKSKNCQNKHIFNCSSIANLVFVAIVFPFKVDARDDGGFHLLHHLGQQNVGVQELDAMQVRLANVVVLRSATGPSKIIQLNNPASQNKQHKNT